MTYRQISAQSEIKLSHHSIVAYSHVYSFSIDMSPA